MRLKKILLAAAVAVSMSVGIAAQQQQGKDVHVAPNAPKDDPIAAKDEELKKIEEALKPHIKKARETYPDAKRRFLAGLPPQHSFFITTRLRDDEGRFDQVFIAVKEIKGGVVRGLIWNDVNLVKGYKHGDEYKFPEGEVLDWTISKPDGTEEGDFIGKFFDSLREKQN